MNKWVIRFSALSALVVSPVLAAEFTITTATTEPVTTAEGDGGGEVDIIITDTGSIELGVLPIPDGEDAAPASVPAVTLNSDNDVVNDGAVTVRHFNDPVGILIEGGNTGDFTLGGSIVVEGSDDGLDSTTNDENTTNDSIGLLLDDAGTFTGNIVTGAGSTITARGESSTGIFLQSEVAGDVLLDGSTMAIGAGSVGVRTTDSITGTFRNSGSITSEPRDDGDGTFVPASAGSGLFIGGGVGDGILNDGPNGGAAPIAHIGTQGSAPALRISPALEFVADQEIGFLTETGLEAYSFVNRGDIIAQPIWPGVDALAIQIGGSDDFMTTFKGDFYNSGAIRALSTSDDANATLSPLFPSDAIAIFFDARSSVPELHNTASGIIEAMTDGPSSGNTLAINIADSASLPSLLNHGSILANSFSTNDELLALAAIAVRDQSGTLRTIVNHGTIAATASGLNTTTIAFDLTEATEAITFMNTGTVIGDIFFGGGLDHSTLTIIGPDASVSGAISSGGTVDIVISGDGSGGALNTSGVRNAGIFDVGAGGVVDLAIGQDLGVLIDAQGVSNFAAGSSLTLTPIAFLAETTAESPYELIKADGGLTVAAGVTDGAEVPFLFNGTFSTDAETLFLDVTLKSANELGLVDNDAAIFPGVARAALQDDELGALLVGITTNAAVQEAVEQFVPLDNNISRAIALMLTDPNGSNVSGRQRRIRMLPAATDEGGVWIAGDYEALSATGADGYDGNGVTGTIGIDWAERGSGHFGVAYSFFHGGADGTGVIGRTVDVDWSLFTLYMGFDNGPAFANAQINVGFGNVEGKRQINVGSLSRTAQTRDWTEILASGNLSGGYLVDLGEFQLAPQVGVEYISLSRSAYEESGAGAGVNLSVRDTQENVLRGFLGASLAGTIDSGGVTLLPQGHVGVQHNFLNDTEAISSEFVSVPGTSYTTFGQQPGATGFVGGFALDVSMGWWTVGAHYDAIIGSGETVHSAGGNMYIRF